MTPREAKMLAVLKAVRSHLPVKHRMAVNKWGRVLVHMSSETIDSVYDSIAQIEMEERKEAMASANDSEAAEYKQQEIRMAARALSKGTAGLVIIAILQESEEAFNVKTAVYGNSLIISHCMPIAAQQIIVDSDRRTAVRAAELGIQVPEVEVQDLSEANQ